MQIVVNKQLDSKNTEIPSRLVNPRLPAPDPEPSLSRHYHDQGERNTFPPAARVGLVPALAGRSVQKDV